jgi:hypothetical protein
MKRNSPNTNALPGQAADRDIGSRPVETTQHADVTRETELRIPRGQAVWVALPFSVAVIVTIITPIAMGPRIFWVTCGVAALAAFLWSVQYELQWLDRVTLPFLVGLVMLCFWRFADFAGWRVPERWQPIPALLSVFALVFWWTLTAAMWLTFWQRLGMPMYHQQYSIWKALGNILEHYGKKERPEPQAVDPEQEPMAFEFIEANGRIRHNVVTPFPRGTMVWIARVLQEETLSEASLCGPDKPLPGGQGGREQLDTLRDWMIERKLVRWNRTNGDGEPIRNQGVSLTADGLRWVTEVGK